MLAVNRQSTTITNGAGLAPALHRQTAWCASAVALICTHGFSSGLATVAGAELKLLFLFDILLY
jgi:hypothetical protein